MAGSNDGCFGQAFFKKSLKSLLKRFLGDFRGSAMAQAVAE
jgi:hypothetical protein